MEIIGEGEKQMKIISYIFILILLTYSYCMADITLIWDANTEDDLAGYKLYYKVDVSGEPYDGTNANEGTSPIDIPLTTSGFDPENPEFTMTGLPNEYIYFIALTAYDTSDNESGYSNEVSSFYFTEPQNDFVINSDNYLEFTIAGKGAAGFDVNVYANDILIETTTTGADCNWSIITDLTNVDEGEVVFHAVTKIGIVTQETIAGWKDTIDPIPPTIPQNLTIVVVSDSQLNLNWDDVEGAVGYTIYRDGVELASINESNYNDTGLEPATTYEYEVSVLDSTDKSELVSATTLPEGTITPPPSSGGGSSSGCFINTILGR